MKARKRKRSKIEENRMDFVNYTDWQETADVLHLLSQMSGKVKLSHCEKRPEWAHIRQYLTLEGISTGIIPCNPSPFEIRFNFRQDQVEFRNYIGKSEVVKLEDGKSIGAYYRQFMAALVQIDAETEICVRPQEFYDPVDFDKDEKHHTYNHKFALLWLDNMMFAYKALNIFLSPFRGKVTCPAYYFGTMDLSCLVYSGEPAPWGKDGEVMPYNFDERNYECGFWPGDVNFPEPAFYGMPYPFIRDLQGNEKFLRPEKAFFKPEKMEFFFTLKDALNYPNPEKMVAEFCRSGFDLIQEISRWKNLDWITRPLEYPKQ